jgi:thiol-disulfide isomerase/thioredoxin
MKTFGRSIFALVPDLTILRSKIPQYSNNPTFHFLSTGLLMKYFSLLSLVLFTSSLFAQQETVIKGKLLGHDNKPMPMAHVYLIKTPQPQPVANVQAGSDGSFKLSTAETGMLVLEFSGVNHSAFDVPIMIEKPTSIDVTVTLATYSYVENMDDIKIMTDLTKFNYADAQPMQKQADGTFKIDLMDENTRLAYQILGAEKNNRSINGTQSESYEFDGAGDYRSIVRPKTGKISIVFDPKKLVRSDAEAEIKFSDPTSTVAKIASIQMEMTNRSIKWSAAATAYVQAGNDFKNFTYDWSTEQASILSRLKEEKSPLVQQALLLDYADTKAKNATTADAAIGTRIFKEVPPDSKLWMMPSLPLMKAAADLAGDQAAYEAYLARFIEKNPDETLKTNLLMNQLMTARMQGDEKLLKIYYDLAMKYFGNQQFGKIVKERFSPTIVIAVGKNVPPFKVKALDDSSKIYTNATFKGKVYLIDFWATWCGPCVAEMESLQKAWDKFKSKKFEILSLSLDRVPEDVKKFRDEKWKMPWLHSFATNDKQLTNDFEVIAIPRALLVDASGKIVAMENDLRGERLEKTLAKFVGQ